MTRIGIAPDSPSKKSEPTKPEFQKWIHGEGKDQLEKTMKTLGDHDAAIRHLRRVFEDHQESPGIQAIGEIFKLVGNDRPKCQTQD